MRKRVPGYRFHKSSGQAIVRLNGRMIYLGDWNSPKSHQAYDREISEWLSRSRQPPPPVAPDLGKLTIIELIGNYWPVAETYYRKPDGRPTGELSPLQSALRVLRQLYGDTPADEFGPLKLRAVREAMIVAGWSRNTINGQVKRVVRLFRWGAENELLPATIVTALDTLPGLRQGKSEAKERPRILPVDEKTVDDTLPHLSPIVADMIRLQLLTGMRPAEVCQIRPGDVDRSEATWTYRPASHKTEHHGRDRVVYIGPKGQAVLAPYLLRAADSYCFSPTESEKHRRAVRHEARTTPLSCGNRPKGLNPDAARPPRDRYDSNSYRVAIVRGCDKAFPVPEEIVGKAAIKAWREAHRWSPNQLRHTFATSVRKHHGLEAAQVLLGHAGADVTQVYAERDADKARFVAGVVG